MTATEWQTSLASVGAQIKNGAITHYGDAHSELAATNSSNVLCDLSHLGLLEIDGADAVTFLQGQVTNDVKLLTDQNDISRAHYTAYCNPKGRMLALFLAFAHHNNQLGNHLHLQVNRELLAAIMKRLNMYIMRSKVNIKDASETIIKFGLNGPQAASMLSPLFSSVPNDNYELVTLENGTLLKLPSLNNQQRFQIFTDTINAPLIWNALKQNCQLVGKPCWDWIEIQLGIPDIELNTQVQFVPQMLNLDLLNAINFKKGCYTGQEIVARTHYLGTVKRRTYLAEITTEAKPGDKVNDASQHAIGQNEIGQIVRVAPNLLGSFDVLVELRMESVKDTQIFCNGAPLKLKTLPYSLEG